MAPLMFLVFVPLLLIAFRLTPPAAAFAVLVVAALAVGFTMEGQGPVNLTRIAPGSTSIGQVLQLLAVLQAFTVACLLATLAASASLSERRRLHHSLKERARVALEARTKAQTALARAEMADQTKARFLAMMSHEIRTPLNGMAGYAELLTQRTDLPPDAQAQLAGIRQSASGFLAMMEDILELAHGGGSLTPEVVAPLLVAEDAISASREAAQAKGLVLALEDRIPAGTLAAIDPRRLRHALHHLISNAVKFTATGQVLVILEQNGDDLAATVADTGPGLPDCVRSQLFQAFEQGDSTITRTHDGAGIGLALVRRQTQLMGGRILVDSQPDAGATFTLMLPVEWSMSTQAEQVTQADDEDVEGRAPLVLVVDDHPINREVAGLMLSAFGCEIVEAHDGAQAVEAAEMHHLDLILMDVRMPVMDGLEATRRIRSLDGVSAMVPIAAMTADAMPEDIARTRAAGMDAHMAKPISQAGLLHILTQALSGELAANREGSTSSDCAAYSAGSA